MRLNFDRISIKNLVKSNRLLRHTGDTRTDANNVEFYKYSLYGNSFVVINQDDNRYLNESELSTLAEIQTSADYGIGCDNVIVFQKLTQKRLDDIQLAHGYWESGLQVEDIHLPVNAPSYIFRMFESSGEEADCCGNALLCLALHLHTHFGIDTAIMLTEIPSKRPVPRVIKYSGQESVVTLGKVQKISNNFFCAHPPGVIQNPVITHEISKILTTIGFQDNFRWHEQDSTVYINLVYDCYLINTGEPHLVIFDIRDCDPPEYKQVFRELLPEKLSESRSTVKTLNFMRAIGLSINSYSRTFPREISVNVARVLDDHTIAYRTFERGILKETLACGTGAVAVGYVARQLGLIPSSDTVKLIPYLAHSLPIFRKKYLTINVSTNQEWQISAGGLLVGCGWFTFKHS